MATASVVIDRARRLAEDIGPHYRWLPVEIIAWINEAQSEIARRRPDLLILSDSQPLPVEMPDEVVDGTSTMGVSDAAVAGVVDYVLSRMFGKRAAFGDSSRSLYHAQRFENLLVT